MGAGCNSSSHNAQAGRRPHNDVDAPARDGVPSRSPGGDPDNYRVTSAKLCLLIGVANSCCLVQVDYYGNHRNMTITVPFLDTVIHHRFTGHFELGNNGLGILTFTSPQIQQELNCLLQDPLTLGCGPRPPDVLVINSGMHDMETPIPTFAMAMRELAQRLRTLQDSGIHVLWRGNNLLPKSHGLDIISKHYITEEGLTFVNTAAVMKHFAADLASGCCADAITGTHIGAIAKYHNASARLTVSSMVTQELLRHICSKQNPL